jgi:uncharacterized MAPEG superfamily protein
MTTELMYLALVTALTSLLWVPYILNMILVRGIMDAVGYPENPAPLSPWAARMKAAHMNAVENLVVFAALVLVAHAAGVSNAATAMACQVYLWARIAHVVSYTARIPWVRTFAFVAGFGCQITLAWQILTGT